MIFWYKWIIIRFLQKLLPHLLTITYQYLHNINFFTSHISRRSNITCPVCSFDILHGGQVFQKVKGQRSSLKVKVTKNKVKVVSWSFLPHRLARGLTCSHFHWAPDSYIYHSQIPPWHRTNELDFISHCSI